MEHTISLPYVVVSRQDGQDSWVRLSFILSIGFLIIRTRISQSYMYLAFNAGTAELRFRTEFHKCASSSNLET